LNHTRPPTIENTVTARPAAAEGIHLAVAMVLIVINTIQ